MRRRGTGATAARLAVSVAILAAVPGFAAQRASDVVYVPAAAHAQGLDFFQTDLVVTNAHSARARVTLQFLETSSDGSRENLDPPTIELGELAMDQSIRIVDVLGTKFGRESAVGALLVFGCETGQTCTELYPDGTPIGAAPLLVTSRTYSIRDGATAGQAIPGIPFYDLGILRIAGIPEDPIFGQMTIVLPGLVESPAGGPPPSYRTNVGFLNGSADVSLTLGVVALDAEHHAAAETEITLAPLAHLQRNRFLRDLGLADGEPWTLRIWVLEQEPVAGVDPSAVSPFAFTAYASTVDNTTGDPTFVEAMFPRSFERCTSSAWERRPARPR